MFLNYAKNNYWTVIPSITILQKNDNVNIPRHKRENTVLELKL